VGPDLRALKVFNLGERNHLQLIAQFFKQSSMPNSASELK